MKEVFQINGKIMTLEWQQRISPHALAQHLLKLMEKIIKIRIEWFTENNYIVPRSQYGFRKCRGSNDSNMTLTADIYTTFAMGQFQGILFLDIESIITYILIIQHHDSTNVRHQRQVLW